MEYGIWKLKFIKSYFERKILQTLRFVNIFKFIIIISSSILWFTASIKEIDYEDKRQASKVPSFRKPLENLCNSLPSPSERLLLL